MAKDASSKEARAIAAQLSHDAREAVLTIEPEGSLQLDGTDAVSLEAAVSAGLADRDESRWGGWLPLPLTASKCQEVEAVEATTHDAGATHHGYYHCRP